MVYLGKEDSILEYFKTIKGEAPVNDLMDGVDLSWNRTGIASLLPQGMFVNSVQKIISVFSVEHPEKSLPELVKLYNDIDRITDTLLERKKAN